MTSEKIQNWFHRTFDNFLKWNKIFQGTVLISVVFLTWQNRDQNSEIQALTVTNSYLLAESMSDSRAVNESPFVWWKKEIEPETEVIIMRDYNNAFYDFFLKVLEVDRFYYVRKTDFAVWPYEAAKGFYDEDLALYHDFIEQAPDEFGNRPMVIRSYKNKFTNLDGTINDSGYWRYVREERGHIYIYGRMKEPIYKYTEQ